MNDPVKYCMKCGEPSLVQKDRNVFTCDICKFELFLNVAGAVAGVLRNSNNEILLVRRAHEPAIGMLDLPGGFINPFETAEQALIREIDEELSGAICELKYIGGFPNVYPYGGMVYYTLDLFYEARLVNEDSLCVNDEISEILYVQPSMIDFNQLGFGSTKRGLEYYCKHYLRDCNGKSLQSLL